MKPGRKREGEFDWDQPGARDLLRELWPGNMSARQMADEIGRRFRFVGMTKNAVVGTAHRMNLPMRPSPIRTKTGEPHDRKEAAARARVTKANRTNGSEGGAGVVATARRVTQAVEHQRREPTPKPAPPPPPPKPVYRGACCWPLGDPGEPGFRFCGDPALLGRPYCEEHSALAYVKITPREREDAPA